MRPVVRTLADEGSVTIEGQDHPLTRGACIGIPPHLAHVYETSFAAPWTIWWMHLRGSDVAELSSIRIAPTQLERTPS